MECVRNSFEMIVLGVGDVLLRVCVCGNSLKHYVKVFISFVLFLFSLGIKSDRLFAISGHSVYGCFINLLDKYR